MVDTGHQRLAYGLAIGFTALAGVLMLLRAWSRLLSQRRFMSDDWLILIAYILTLGQTVASCIYIKIGYVGIHIWDVPPLSPEDVLKQNKWIFINQVLYNPSLTFVKVSVLMFLRRIDSRNRIVVCLWWSTMVLTVGIAIAVLFADIFQCTPVAFEWDKSIEGGHCMNAPAFFVITAALNIFTDLLVLVIPVIITWPLQLAIRKKIAICFILCLGLISTSVGGYRLHMLKEMFYPSGPPRTDVTYSVGFTSSVVEESGAIAAACGPSLKALISVYLPNLLGKSNGSHEETSGPRRQLQRSSGYIRSDEQGQIEMGDVYAQMHGHDKDEGPWGGETFVVSDIEAGKNTTTITGEVRNNDQIMKTTNLAVSSYRV